MRAVLDGRFSVCLYNAICYSAGTCVADHMNTCYHLPRSLISESDCNFCRAPVVLNCLCDVLVSMMIR